MLSFASDFERMGSAIEQRFRRCAPWWRPHLEATATFISHNVPESSSVAVLGAGLTARPQCWSILITDTEYYFYHSDDSEWRVESALCGDAKEVYRTLRGERTRDRWLWHVAPQFVESDDEGEIHLVEASAAI
jgi:hypothetical protein